LKNVGAHREIDDNTVEKDSNYSVGHTPVRYYDDYENKKNAYAMSMFANFNDRNPKKGWKPSASIVTDTVALSVTYERTIRDRLRGRGTL
jgi:hypothetical protein